MAETIKGINVVIGAETTGLQKALSDVNKQSRNIQSELRQVERLLKYDPENTELLAQKQELLNKAIETTSEKLSRLKTAQQQVNEQFQKGEITEGQYRAFQREIIKTEGYLKNLETQLSNTGSKASTFKDKIEQASSKLKSFGESTKNIGQKLTTSITVPLTGIAALATKGTEELRQDLSKLETNAELAGASISLVHEELKNLNAITGETDSNVEALSNLLEAGFTEDTAMQKAVENLSGAVIKFPDTLKIESLSDSLQETLATGEATGQFAELLERMGINLETFNNGLERATKRGQEQQYVLQTLAQTGLAEVNQAYRENNQELIENANAQWELQQQLAELGKTLQPVLTDIAKAVSDLLKWFNGLSDGTKSIILGFAGVAMAIGPVLTGIGQLSLGLSTIGKLFAGTSATATAMSTATTAAGTAAAGASGLFSGLGTALAGIAGPAAIAIGVAAAVGAASYLIIKNWDKIKEFFAKLWEGIKNIFSAFWDWLKKVFFNYHPLGLIIKNWDGIKDYFSEMWDNIKQATSNAFSKIGETITSVFDKVKNIPKEMINLGKNIIQGLINGIKSMITKVASTVKNVASTITGGIKTALGIHSPSRVMQQMGEYTGEGFVNGLKSTISEVNRQANKLADATQVQTKGYSSSFSTGSSTGVGGTVFNFNVDISSVDDLIKYAQMMKKAQQTARAY